MTLPSSGSSDRCHNRKRQRESQSRSGTRRAAPQHTRGLADMGMMWAAPKLPEKRRCAIARGVCEWNGVARWGTTDRRMS